MRKKEEIKPEIVESGNTEKVDSNLIQIAQSIEKSTVINNPNNNDETFYKTVVKELNDKTNISAKTEYLTPRENFAGSRAEFFGVHCNVPYLESFIHIFEQKRVSLERKGRKELLMALQERRQEIEEKKVETMSKMFNVT